MARPSSSRPSLLRLQALCALHPSRMHPQGRTHQHTPKECGSTMIGPARQHSVQGHTGYTHTQEEDRLGRDANCGGWRAEAGVCWRDAAATQGMVLPTGILSATGHRCNQQTHSQRLSIDPTAARHISLANLQIA